LANCIFLYSYIRSQIDTILAWLDEHVARDRGRRTRMAAFCWAVVLFAAVSSLPQLVTSHPTSWAIFIMWAVQGLVYMRAGYSCALWMWLVNEMRLAGDRCVEELTARSVVKQDASRKLVEVLDFMHVASNDWRINHLMRVSTSAMISCIWFVWAPMVGGVFNYFMATLVLALVVMMWTWPSYVSDRLWTKLYVKLAHLAHADEPEQPSLEQACTQLALRLETLRGHLGINFAGVTVTMQRAWFGFLAMYGAVGAILKWGPEIGIFLMTGNVTRH